MADRITGPSVLTRLKIGGFTLNVYAYRVLTKQESMRAVALYMQQKHIKALPSHGSASLFMQFGSDPSAGV